MAGNCPIFVFPAHCWDISQVLVAKTWDLSQLFIVWEKILITKNDIYQQCSQSVVVKAPDRDPYCTVGTRIQYPLRKLLLQHGILKE